MRKCGLMRRTSRISMISRWQNRLNRRVLLSALVRLPLIGTVAMSGQRALAARRSPRGESHTALTIATVVDHMLPGGELPGAQTLGIARRIASTPDPDLKRSFARGVAWLDARTHENGGSNFLALDQARKEAVLQAALASHADGAGDFVRELRNLAFTRYYTHPTIMAAFAYSGPPQPAGFPDFQEAPR